MNREDVIRMAEESMLQKVQDRWIANTADLMRLVELATSVEREACAKVCEARFMGDLNREDEEARRCAKAIRARGNP